MHQNKYYSLLEFTASSFYQCFKHNSSSSSSNITAVLILTCLTANLSACDVIRSFLWWVSICTVLARIDMSCESFENVGWIFLLED